MTRGARRAEAVAGLTAALVHPNEANLPSTPSGWSALLDCAMAHGLAPALWVALRDAGRAAPVPSDARAWIRTRKAGVDAPLLLLQDAYDANVAAQTRLLELGRLVSSALTVGAVLPLKGLHTLLVELWDDPGVRVMVDLDVLARSGTADEAYAALRAAGLVELPNSLGEYADHQLPVLEHANGGFVEVHTHALRQRWEALLPVDDIVAASGEHATPLGRWTLMNATHAVVVLVAHGQLQDDTFRRLELPLRALFETDRWVRADRAVDWDEVARRFDAIHAGAVLRSHFASAASLFGTPNPLGTTRHGRFTGRAHALAAGSALRAPRAHRAYNYLQYLPRSFRRERMVAEYGPPTGRTWLARARVHHVADRLRARARG